MIHLINITVELPVVVRSIAKEVSDYSVKKMGMGSIIENHIVQFLKHTVSAEMWWTLYLGNMGSIEITKNNY